MNVKRIIIISLVAVVGLALIKLVPLAWLFTAGLRTPINVPEPDYWPTEGWRTSLPEEQGFDSAQIAQGLLTLQENQVDIDSLMIIRNGYVVLDAYFDPYDGTFPHDLASVTKSVMTTLIGIAADQRVIDLDQPVISFFPQAFQGWMAFTDYGLMNLRFNILNPETWETFAPPVVGLENFVRVLSSRLPIENYDFLRLLWFNFSWTFANVFFHVAIGIVIALVLNSKELIGRRFYRAIFVLPWAIPGLIISFTWRNMFDVRFGAINQSLTKISEWLGLSINTDIRWLEVAQAPGKGIPGLILSAIVFLPLALYFGNSLIESKSNINESSNGSRELCPQRADDGKELGVCKFHFQYR